MISYKCDLCPNTNEIELKAIRIGKGTLDLCPDCRKKFVDLAEKLRENASRQ